VFKVFLTISILFHFSVGLAADDFKTVDTDIFLADYKSAEETGKYGILVLGGSGGGKPTRLADRLAGYGHAVLSLAYFKEDGLPAELNEIPLEYFDAPKKWLMDRDDTRSDGVIIVGWSKGAELALLLASQDDAVKGVVGIAPSSVVWAGILDDWRKVPSSSWTQGGQPLVHVPFAQGVQITKLTDLYAASLEQEEFVTKARIRVEDIKGAVLLLTGGQDEIWPANEMAVSVCEKIREGGTYCNHTNFPTAGHLLDSQIVIGGTKEANTIAENASETEIGVFLKSFDR